MSYIAQAASYFDRVEEVSDFDLREVNPWLSPQYVKGHIDLYVRGFIDDGNWDATTAHGLFFATRTIDGALQKLNGDGAVSWSSGTFEHQPLQGIQGVSDNHNLLVNQEWSGTIVDCSMWVYVPPRTYAHDNGRWIAVGGQNHIVGSSSTGAMRVRAHSSGIYSHGTSFFSGGMMGWSRSSGSEYRYVVGDENGENGIGATSASYQPFSLLSQNGSNRLVGRFVSAWGGGNAVDLVKIRDRLTALDSALRVFTPLPPSRRYDPFRSHAFHSHRIGGMA